MAFLLSPKTGGGDSNTYTLITSFMVSVNDQEPHVYTKDSPGTVKPGDIIGGKTSGQLIYEYISASDMPPQVIESGKYTSPFTVEAVTGADRLEISSRAS